MKPASVFKKILIPLCLPYTLFLGCSAIGALAGAASSPAQDAKILRQSDLDYLIPGTEVKVVLFNRETREGTFKRITSYVPKMYPRVYDSAVARSGYRGFVPGIGRQITLASVGKREDGYFCGIDRGAVLFSIDMLLDTTRVPLEDVEWLASSDSLRLEGAQLRKLVRQGSMPGIRLVEIQKGDHEAFIPSETIEIVQVEGKSSGALTGFLIGAAIDLTAIIVIVNGMENTSHDCGNSFNQSCSHGSRR